MMSPFEHRVCPGCGADAFIASQVCYHDVIVDGHNNFIEDIDISQSENPHGPWTCQGCRKEFGDLDDLKSEVAGERS